MTNTRISQTSFSRGELSPTLHKRTDLKHYSIGLKTLKNGFVHQEGCVSNRSGLEFVGEVKDSSKKTRLFPFVFNTEQTYIIEAGEKYFRFIQNGGYIVYPNNYGTIYKGNVIVSDTAEDYIEYSLDDEKTIFYTDTNGLSLNANIYSDSDLSNKSGIVEEYTSPFQEVLTGTVEQNITDIIEKITYQKLNLFWTYYYGFPYYDTITQKISTNDLISFENIFTFDLVSESDYNKIYTKGSLSVDSNCYTKIKCEYNKKLKKWEVSLSGLIGKISSINDNEIEIVTLSGGYVVVSNEEEISQRNKICEIETPYKEEDLQQLKYAQYADVLTITHNDYPIMQLCRYDHYRWELSEVILKSSINPPANINAEWKYPEPQTEEEMVEALSNLKSYTYLVTAVDRDTNEESEGSKTITRQGHAEAYWKTNEYMKISWSAVDNAIEYNIYRAVNGIYGYIGTSITTSFTDRNIEPDLTATAPNNKNPFEDDNNPACCAYFQQRKVYGNLKKYPQMLVASKSGATNNFSSSRPLVATDAFEIALMDREVNEIRHLIPFKDLIVLTSNTEYKVNGADGIMEANPLPVSTVQSTYGSSHVQPVISGEMVLFVQAGGSVIRDLGYDYLSDSYNGDELSLFASHIFEGKEITYMAYAKEPYRILYVIFNDGTMATLTYNKKQDLCGWGRAQTQGQFENVTVIREGNEDVAYFVIKRIINNQTVRYIERTKTRIINNAKKGFFVDCGLYKHFDIPVTNISGLEHLKNMDVIALADGGVITDLKVSDIGTLTLPDETTDLIVGLPYEFEFETLGIDGENTHGLKKQINFVTVCLLNSREDFFVCGNDGSEYQLARSLQSINDSGYLYSGKKDMTVQNSPTDYATIHLKQKYPLPITITAVSAIVNCADVAEG